MRPVLGVLCVTNAKTDPPDFVLNIQVYKCAEAFHFYFLENFYSDCQNIHQSTPTGCLPM